MLGKEKRVPMLQGDSLLAQQLEIGKIFKRCIYSKLFTRIELFYFFYFFLLILKIKQIEILLLNSHSRLYIGSLQSF